MELLHVILEALGFSLCLGGMILLYARICMQHRNIERINGKLDMIRLHDLKRIREELAEKHGIFIDDTCEHEYVVEDFDMVCDTLYYKCLDCGKCHSTPFGTVRNRGGLR